MILGVALGWFLGSLAMWTYFHAVRLVRTKHEWYADRERRGAYVPPDWRDEPDEGY
jgi:hypothetical protein